MFPSSDIPTSPVDVILWPLIWVIIGLIVWYIGLRVEFNTEKTTIKWLSLVPLSIGTLIGAAYAYKTFDFAYQALMDRKLILYAHYVALILPLGAIAFVFAWNWHQKRQASDMI